MTSEPGADSAAASERPVVDFEVELARTRALEPDFLGLSRAEAEIVAKGLGLELRVIEAADTALSADLHTRRITIDVRTGAVTSAMAG
ncbi:MAG: hypothetical protein M3Y42_13200 [Actinomycetota bacterium]|nr:hypothetical protein [Actinomycetota bacterium]MDQ2957911.1 hypothetical protein [Actinomycetota bacterium]